ncbi:MAG: helix-turn-helix domain-containing protein [Chloroflexi bacterium]|nr:helix-turn-helix domain-containing protein [Chloroflexota bacterium]
MDYLLDTQEVCDLLKRSKASFARDRKRGDSPPAVKIGGSVRFRASDVARYIAAHTEGEAA